MPGFNPDKINIHDLTIEEPEKNEARFDVEKDITEEDWKGMEDELKDLRNKKEWTDLSRLATNIKIFDSNRDLKLDPIAKREISKARKKHTGLDRARRNGNWIGFSYGAVEQRILYPNRDIGVKESDLQRMKVQLNSIKDSFKEDKWGDFTRVAWGARIIDPNFDLGITKKDRESIQTYLDKVKKNPWIYAQFVITAMISDPKMKVSFDEEAVQPLKGELDNCRKKDSFTDFIVYATALKMLFSDSVDVTSNGVKITMPSRRPSLKSEAPQMPEQRNF